jgi:hypothetical protein
VAEQGCVEAEEGRAGPRATMLIVRATPSSHAAGSGVRVDPNFWLSAGVTVVGQSNMLGSPPTASVGVLRPGLRVF